MMRADHVMLLRHYRNAYRFVELDPSGCRFRHRRWRNVRDVLLRRPTPRYHGLYQVVAGVEFALYSHKSTLYVKVGTRCLPASGSLRASVRAVDEQRVRFELVQGDATLFELEYERNRELFSEVDLTPFRDLDDEDLPAMVAAVLHDDDRREDMSARWADGLTIRG
jgi:hypothetical protein